MLATNIKRSRCSQDNERRHTFEETEYCLKGVHSRCTLGGESCVLVAYIYKKKQHDARASEVIIDSCRASQDYQITKTTHAPAALVKTSVAAFAFQ